MDYPLYCVIPSSRILHFVPETITFIVGESFSEEDHEVGHHGEEREHHSIDVWLENGMRLKHTDTELGLRFKFNFISRLWFLHESELKHIANNPIGESALNQRLDEDACRAVLSEGRFHKDTSIRFVNNVLNYGLYADKPIAKGVMIGEYVGIVHSVSSQPNQYSLFYPTISGNHQIDSREYGNATRFINHASDPNCKYVHVLIDGLNHTLCITKRNVHANEQITVNYGPSYWMKIKEEYNIEPMDVADEDEYRVDHCDDCCNEESHEDLMCHSLTSLCPLFCISSFCAVSHACCCEV